KMSAHHFLLPLLLLLLLLNASTLQAQVLGGGHCRPTVVPVKEGGQVCERLCYQRGYRGPPMICRPVTRTGLTQVCGNGCCRSGFSCLQLLRT
ncbi:hypothetical protein KR018_008041, partial [Drosophila ironensis]